MGWAQLLLILNIPYASIQAIELGEKLMKFIKEKSLIPKRPGTGIPPNLIYSVIGKTAKKNIFEDQLITKKDFC